MNKCNIIKLLGLFFCLALLAAPASAGWSWRIGPIEISSGIFGGLVPGNDETGDNAGAGGQASASAGMGAQENGTQNTVQATPVYHTITRFNTEKNVLALSAEMEKYGVESVSVTVTDTGEKFYLIKDQGLTERYNMPVDARATVTSEDIKFASGKLEDGELGALERYQLVTRFRDRVKLVSDEAKLPGLSFYAGGVF